LEKKPRWKSIEAPPPPCDAPTWTPPALKLFARHTTRLHAHTVRHRRGGRRTLYPPKSKSRSIGPHLREAIELGITHIDTAGLPD
jgi:hypothetical protein